MQYATRLNSLKSRPELFFPPGRITTLDLLRRATQIQGLTSLSMNYPEHFADTSLTEVRQFLGDAGLTLDSLNIRFPAADFGDGGFTHPDPRVRQAAIDLTCRAVDACVELGGQDIIVWPGYDGFDYPFQDEYARMFDDTVRAFAHVAAHNPAVRIGIEYKPREPRKHSLLANMGETLLAVSAVDADNLGVVLDYCHTLMANEHPPKVAGLALGRGKLFGVHLNDGYGQQDDGMMVGTASLVTTVELLVTLLRHGYAGSIYFDTFPIREDPVRECEWNIRISERLLGLARDVVASTPPNTTHDPFSVTRVIEQLLIPERVHV